MKLHQPLSLSITIPILTLLILTQSAIPNPPVSISPNPKPNASSLFSSTIVSDSGANANAQSTVVDSKSNGLPVGAVRDNLREDLRKKLISSLTYGAEPPVVSVATAVSATSASATVITISPNNVLAANSSVALNINSPQSQTVANTANTLARRQAQIINQVKVESQQASLSTMIETIFSRLPQPQQLDQLIMTTDSFALVKTIQQVSESNLTCEQKISYLSDFFGRIEAAISMKNYTLNKLVVVIEGAKAEVKRLSLEIQRNNQSITSLGLQELKRKLNDGLDQLSVAYNNFNKIDSTVQPKKNAIDKSQATIDDLKAKIDSGRQELPTKNLELLEINKNIALLEQQLNDAKAKKNVTEAYISNLDQNIKKYEAKVAEEKNSVSNMEAQLTRIYAQYDRTKSKYKVLEVDVERLRTEIAQKQKKQSQLTSTIVSLQTRMTTENKKIDLTLQSKLQSLIKDLITLTPSLQTKIDQINFRCNQVKQIETITLRSGEVTLFLLTPRDFNSYILSSYNIKQDIPNLKPIKVSLSSTSILDKAWIQSFGNPYPSDTFYESGQFVFKGDFTCLEPSGLETGSGVVVGVSRKFVEIQDGGVRMKLNLGTCTRIEAVQAVPQVGQRLYFRGKKLSQGEYNVYKASCF